MVKNLEKYKGIHPGKVIERELKKHNLKQLSFANSINEYPQTFNAVIKGKRGIGISLALKVEKALQMEEGALVILQAYYDIQKIKNKEKKDTPNLSLFRKSLFWDTDILKIDWKRQHRAVIQRVFERGNEIEKKEIKRFYGLKKINEALDVANLRSSYTIRKLDKSAE